MFEASNSGAEYAPETTSPVDLFSFNRVAASGLAAGTILQTDAGPKPIETLTPGDRIQTHDHGMQTLLWIGKTTAWKSLSRVSNSVVAAETLVLRRPAKARALYGQNEVFIRADALPETVMENSDGPVDIHHILFARHMMLEVEDEVFESFYPDRKSLELLSAEDRGTLLAKLPNTDALLGYGYGPRARTNMRLREIRTLLAA